MSSRWPAGCLERPSFVEKERENLDSKNLARKPPRIGEEKELQSSIVLSRRIAAVPVILLLSRQLTMTKVNGADRLGGPFSYVFSASVMAHRH